MAVTSAAVKANGDVGKGLVVDYVQSTLKTLCLVNPLLGFKCACAHGVLTNSILTLVDCLASILSSYDATDNGLY